MTDDMRDGFTGTVPGFVDWLNEHLVYGAAVVGEPKPDSLLRTKQVREVRLVTGGYSSDEALLGRVFQGSVFMLRFWQSLHRGGLYVYEVPVDVVESDELIAWLEPKTDDAFETIARARVLRVRDQHGEEFLFDLPTGAKLGFSEPDRDINEPAGVLTVEPFDEDDIRYPRSPASPGGHDRNGE